MILTHSMVNEFLRSKMQGFKLNGYNELGVWYDRQNKSTGVFAWSEVTRWAREREIARREHCEFDADQERDEPLSDENGDGCCDAAGVKS